jgi:hypothetical protein
MTTQRPPSSPASATFLDREDGAISVEAAFMLPLLTFAYIAGFSFFDAYRREAALTRATYTVADILSRVPETETVGPRDFEALQELFEFMTSSDGATRLRFTQIQRVGDDLVITESTPGIADTYATDGSEPMTVARLDTIRSQIPRLADGDSIMVTEAFATHSPIFAVGLVEREFRRVAPTPNRWSPQVEWDFGRTHTPPPVETFDVASVTEPTIPGFDEIAMHHAPNPESGGTTD